MSTGLAPVPFAGVGGAPGSPDNRTLAHLFEVIQSRRLTAFFQPIIDTRCALIVGYEGLIRGPSDSPLHSPLPLFGVAERGGVSLELERLCRKVVIESFVRLGLQGKLFLNVSPTCLLEPNFKHGETLRVMEQVGLSPERVIIELTERQPTHDYGVLREATVHYRNMGFEIAIDDLGEGFSGLRLWSELRPSYVKIDRHFIENINRDPVKLQFVKSIQQIAENAASTVIAEGIETEAELLIVKDLGIPFGQGYFIGRPNSMPIVAMMPAVDEALRRPGIAVHPQSGNAMHKTVSASILLIEAPTVEPGTPNETVYRLFAEREDLHAIPVVRDHTPVGMINRFRFFDVFSRLYSHELHGRKPCEKLMDTAPLVVEKSISIQDLSRLVVASERRYLWEGFIITDNGRYAGIGTGHDLMHQITELQVNAARYANPLTLLPGNVPINEHISRLLRSGAEFVVCYCDLDHFKAFNDHYGYRRGDDVIQAMGRILSEGCDQERDFVGHIGGDDFIALFQSPDWEVRCANIVARFDAEVAPLFSVEDRAAGGYFVEDRRGEEVFHPLVSVSIGCVEIAPGTFHSHHEIAAVATEAKKQAKRIPGGSVFVNRRRYGE